MEINKLWWEMSEGDTTDTDMFLGISLGWTSWYLYMKLRACLAVAKWFGVGWLSGQNDWEALMI